MKTLPDLDFFRKNRVLCIVLVLAVIIRIFGLGSAPFFDEVAWLWGLDNFFDGADYSLYVPHPPLPFMAYASSAYVFGMSVVGLRSVAMVAGILTILAAFCLSSLLYGKRAAAITALIMSVLFYHVWSSLHIDADGSFLALFVTLTLYSYVRLRKGGDVRWALASGLFLGLAMLSKYPAIVLIPVLFFAQLLEGRLANWRKMLLVFALGFAVFSFFPLYSILTGNPDLFLRTVALGQGYISSGTSVSLTAMLTSLVKSCFFLFQYMTPLLPLLVLFAFMKDRTERKGVLMITIACFIIFYSFVMSGGSKSRYISVIIAPMSIVAGNSLSRLAGGLSSKDFLKMFLIAMVFFATIASLSSYGINSNFNSNDMSLRLLTENAFFWYNGFTSEPFAIRTHSLLFALVVSLSCFPFLLSKRLMHAKIAVLTLISVCAAFNFFILLQSYYPTIGPDYSQTVSEMVSYQTENAGMETYGITFTEAFIFLAGFGDNRMIGFTDAERLGSLNGRLAVLDLQVFDNPDFRESKESIDSRCEAEHVFISNGYPFGYFFVCGKTR